MDEKDQTTDVQSFPFNYATYASSHYYITPSLIEDMAYRSVTYIYKLRWGLHIYFSTHILISSV